MKATRAALLTALLGVAACSSSGRPAPKTTSSEPRRASGAPAPRPASATAEAPEIAPVDSSDPEPPEPLAGRDFIEQARLLLRVGACTGDAAIPSRFDRAYLERYCNLLGREIEDYRDEWLSKARPFFRDLVPDGLPADVVYPFGGGDLLTALVVFPDLREITTLSLEPAGDPRTIETIDRENFEQALGDVRLFQSYLLRVNHNATDNMEEIMTEGRLPAQLIFCLVALSILEYEPISLRYFRLDDDGSLHYLTGEDIAEAEDSLPRHPTRRRERQNANFGNMELRFRPADGGPVRVYRHIQANLEDDHLDRDDPILRHLRAKGRVSAMTKAASFLLWWRSFSTIRDYLLEHMAWMVSDATGIPPRYAEPAGFEQITYGRFTGPFIGSPGRNVTREWRALWKESPDRELPMRFGYPSRGDHDHLVVTRPED